jgi:hypothetical protein
MPNNYRSMSAAKDFRRELLPVNQSLLYAGNAQHFAGYRKRIASIANQPRVIRYWLTS